jgi:hypothetical protein
MNVSPACVFGDTVQATVRTLRDLSKLIVNNIIILAQKRPDGELLPFLQHRNRGRVAGPS